MKKFLLFMFCTEQYEKRYCSLPEAEQTILDLANLHDITEEEVLYYAAKHAGVQFTMDDLFKTIYNDTHTIPWQLKQWLRLNS